MINKKTLTILIAAIIIFIVTGWVITKKPASNINKTSQVSSAQQNQSNESPRIVSTKPDPLDENIVSATETIEITFNRPLQNSGEFKVRLEPKIDYKVELSGDRKTAKIIPLKPYFLGTTYTMFIGPETKFDGTGRWGEEKVFHFKTITYRGV